MIREINNIRKTCHLEKKLESMENSLIKRYELLRNAYTLENFSLKLKIVYKIVFDFIRFFSMYPLLL